MGFFTGIIEMFLYVVMFIAILFIIAMMFSGPIFFIGGAILLFFIWNEHRKPY